MGQEKRVVAVTGGTRGIGRAVAELFLGRGDVVAVCSRSPREASLPEEIAHLQADVRRRADVKRFTAFVAQRWGRLDVFVNCAGISRWRSVEEIDEAFAQEVIETSFLGSLWGCACAAETMAAGGCIVNVSSLAGKRGSANNSVYCAAKFAVNGMTQALAKELGPRGIRVNAVCPVYVETEHLLASLAEPESPARGQSIDAYLSTFATTQAALGRLPTREEVAEAIYFLSSPAASAITGQCLNIDCGVLPQETS